ncbi:DUF1837 domain-containing protein [Lachnotalea sp. AF33-28]|nr:DUF1837 domain-containing protein [Lachnotalea sp. AF33-28]
MAAILSESARKKFYTADLQTALYRNIGKYVFSRAALEDFHINDDDDSVISQALKVMRENGAADTKGTGNELGEMLVYTLLEEKLDAPKILSRGLSRAAKPWLSMAATDHMNMRISPNKSRCTG